MAEFRNWSGELAFTPATTAAPADEDAVLDVVRKAVADRATIRPVGAGHSFSHLVRTDDVLVSLHRLAGLIDHDHSRREATAWAGTVVGDLGAALDRVGLAMENIGDVAYQAIAGAVGTGTHGTGRRLGHLATQVVGARLVTGEGEVIDCDEQHRADLLRAVRVSLGALGIVTRLRLRVVPAHQLHRLAWCAHVDDVLAHLDELIERNHLFDFYWYPRSDQAQIRTLNEPGREPELTVPVDRLHADQVGPPHEVLPKAQELRYQEMEYLLPAEAGPECLQEVRTRIKQRHRHYVGWRVLYRTIASDDAYLSPCYGRDSVSIALLQNVTLPYREYFADLEPIFRAYGGRPHWGKEHSLTHAELAPLYPEWEQFLALRRECDPHGRFLNDHLRTLFGEEK